MADVEFLNRDSVKWVDSFDSYLINSNVSTDSGAELTFGSSEVLAATNAVTSDVQALLTLGIVEFVASTIPTSSVSGFVSLEIGELEGLTYSEGITTNVDAFITFGVAEGISGSAVVQSNVSPNLSLGIIELVSSTIIYTSAITGEPFYGTTYYHLANPHAQSVTSSPELAIGIVELLSTTLNIEPVVSGFIILGKEEVVFGNTGSKLEAEATLSLGIIEGLSATTNVVSNTNGLITIGINELLSSTTISISVAPDVGLDLGGDEVLEVGQLINSMVYTAELSLGEPEPLSSSIHIQSNVDNLFTIGVVEILASTFPISTDVLDSTLDIGGDEELVSTGAVAESSVSVFLTFGITEPLSGSTHFQSTIRKGGAWSDLTIGHVELLAHTADIITYVELTNLDIGADESLEHSTLIQSVVDIPILYIGLTEFLSSIVVSTLSTPPATLTVGIDEPLSASIDIETASSAFVLMGTTEQLSATIDNITTTQNSLLTIGFVELLSSTVLSITITDAEAEIGGSEIQSGTGSAVSYTYAILSLGESVDLSGSLHIQSVFEGIFSFGIMEILSASTFHVGVINADLELGLDTELDSSPIIQTSGLGTLDLGVNENLNSTNNIVSVTSVVSLFLGADTSLQHTVILPGYDFGTEENNYDPPDHFAVSSLDINLTTGSSEELTGTSLSFTSNVPAATLSIGAVEVLLSTASIVSTAGVGILTTGIIEVLASTTAVHSVSDATLFIGGEEELSSTINVETGVDGAVIFGGTEILSSAINIQSFIRRGGDYSTLTLGVVEILEHTSVTHSNVQDTSLIIGGEESLSATYYILGNTQCDALLTTGKVEVLGSSSIIQSQTTTEITMGVVEELSGTVNATIEGGTITGVLTLGIVEDLSSTNNIVSVVSGEIVIGVLEILASTIATTSDVSVDLILGQDEPFTSGVVIESVVTVYLTMGIAEQLDSTINLESVVGSDLNIGVDVPLTNVDNIVSVVNITDLTIGIVESLSSHPYIQPVITANLGLGILEVLGATSITQASLPGDLTLGADELLEVTNLVQSNVIAELEMGAATPLEGTSSIVSYVMSLLDLGVSELLATSNFSISITDAEITLGADEELSHLEYIHSNVSSDLTLGIENPLSHSTTIQSVVDNTDLIVGVVELLASTSIATLSTPPASIGFGSGEPVEGSTLVQSNVSLDPDMIIGIDELFSSTNISTVSFPPGELSLGVPEPLSATTHVQPNVEDVLNLGGQENLSSTIVIGHLVLNTIDMVVGGPVICNGTINFDTDCYGTWLYVPGNLEVLTSTINPEVSVITNLITDDEKLESTDNVITTAEASILSVGVIEVASSTNFTISIVGSTLEMGVGNILDSTQNIISNVVNAELTLGTFIPLYEDITITSNVESELILGAVELVATSLFAISITDSDLTIGHVEELSSTLDIEFGFAGFLNIPGQLELLSATQEVISTASTGQLIVGRVELGGSSLSITSSVSAISIDTGNPEELSASILAWSVTFTAKLDLGGEYELSATCPIVSNVTTDLDKPQALESTIDIISNVVGDTLLFGIITQLSSNTFINSNSVANLAVGDITPLSGSIQTARSFAFAYLTNPTIYLQSDQYSLWNKAISYVRAGFIDVDGIVELESTGYIESVVESTISTGLPDELESTILIQSITNDAELFIGYTELVSSTNFTISITDAALVSPTIYVSSDIGIQSVVNDARLTGPEYLYGNAIIQSDLTGNIVEGRVELVSAQDDIVSSVNVELTLGIVEDLSATIGPIDVTISIPEVIYNVHLNSLEESLWNKVISFVDEARLRVTSGLYTSEIFIQSSTTQPELLTLGVSEVLSATVNAESMVDANLTIGELTELSSTIFIHSNVNGYPVYSDYVSTAFAQTEVWATLTLGVAEHFESGNVDIVSVVENDGLIIGAIDFYGDNTISTEVEPLLEVLYSINSDILVQSVVNVELTIGAVSDLTHTTIITTVVDTSELDLGAWEELSHGGTLIESFVDGFIYTGVEYGVRGDIDVQSVVGDADLFIGDKSSIFSRAHAQSHIITPYMFRGRIEELSANNVVVVSDTEVNLLLGAVELLSSTIASHSVTDAVLYIGLETDLSATVINETNSSGHFIIGTTEILSHTTPITSVVNLSDPIYLDIKFIGLSKPRIILSKPELVVGSQESLSSTATIISTAVAEQVTGEIEPVYGSANATTQAISTIDIGYAEHLNGSAICSINIYDLELVGIVEELSSSINLQSVINTFLTIGVSESLASSINLVVTETDSELVIGHIETLYARPKPFVECNSDTLWLDIEFNEVVAIESNIPDVELTMGGPASLSSWVTITTECTIEPVFIGEEEILSSSVVAQSYIEAYFTLGLFDEELSSSITVTSVSAEIELEADSVYALSRKITADLQYWYDYFVVNNKSLNKHQIQFPSKNEEYHGSFIELLFSENYNASHYRYLYREVEDRLSWPDNIRARLMLDPENAHYYIADGDDPDVYNINLYNIQSDDIIMLDRLLVYRLEPENATLVGIDYDSLDTALSKMIYIYLELRLTGIYTKYDNIALYSRPLNTLETCYETYLTQSIFEHVSAKGT